MRYIILIIIGILTFSSCNKENITQKIIPEEPTVIPISIDATNMPIISDDRQEIKRHLKTMVPRVKYTKKNGIWIIEANFKDDESEVFKQIHYEINSTDFELKKFDMSYTFKDGLSETNKKKVAEYINNNSKIIL